MKTMDIAITLFKKVEPLTLGYKSDLAIDIVAICHNFADYGKVSKFIHLTREYGTHMDFLLPKEAYPEPGQVVPYLFGHVNRLDLVDRAGANTAYFSRPNSGTILQVLYYTGEDILTIDLAEAAHLINEYKTLMRTQLK